MPEGSPSLLGDDQWPGDAADDPLMVGLEDEAPEAEPTTPETVLPEATVEVPPPAEPEAPATTEGTETPPETPAPEPSAELITFGGRQFPSMEEAERSYTEAQRTLRESQTRTNQERQAAQRAQAEAQALREQFRTLAPLIEQARRPAIDPALLDQMGLDPQQAGALQQWMDAQVQSRVAPVTEQMESDRVAREWDENIANRDGALASFRSTTPDIPPEQQDAMVDLLRDIGVIETLKDPRSGQELDKGPRDPAWYTIAHEATGRPALARVLRAHPDWAETDEGLDDARLLAAQHEGQAALAARAPAGTPAPTAPPAPGAAAVLTGPANTPADTQAKPKDAIDEIVESDRASRRPAWVTGI